MVRLTKYFLIVGDSRFGRFLRKNSFLNKFAIKIYDYQVQEEIEEIIDRRGGYVILQTKLIRPVKFTYIYHGDLLTIKQDEYIIRHMEKDSTIWDVGANVGYCTLPFAKSFKQVVAFEPFEGNYNILTENINLNKASNVILSKYALGIKNGYTKLFVDREAKKTNKADPFAAFRRGGNTMEIKIKVIKGDDAITKLGYPKPDGIKMDIEGAEIEAIEGMKKLLSNNKPDLFVEIHKMKLLKLYKTSSEDLKMLLKEFGYRNTKHILPSSATQEWVHFKSD